MESNMIITDMYLRLLTGPTEHNMIITDLYPRLLTGPTEEYIIINHPNDSMIGNVLP